MAKALVVVESPAKAKTINKYLGRDYKVVASMGHIRDLPKSKLGVDVDNDFEETYESIESRKKVIKELKDAAKDATDIYVATDPDREGEAIGWHLIQELKGKKRKIHRLTFNEITKKAVQEALNHPRAIDEKMVAAQRARRVLDRLVGYKISPLLWDKVRRGLSAGRVQSVALKLICDREREIESFVPVEYWHLFARLAGAQPPEFEAKLHKKKGENIVPANEAESNAVLAALDGAKWVVSSVTTKERKRHAAPPFITSKLQQTARFPVKKTMMLAQQLYEGGIDIPGLTGGLITYMRTDSVRIADRSAGRTPRVHSDCVRSRVSARKAERLQVEGRCAGRARGDSSDFDAARSRDGQAVPDGRSVLALPTHLEPVRRLADAARHVR
jgi:DNA topoisomerase-1